MHIIAIFKKDEDLVKSHGSIKLKGGAVMYEPFPMTVMIDRLK